MKKLKAIHIILILIIVFLYGFIFSQLFDPNDSTSEFNAKSETAFAQIKKHESIALINHSIDPFRSKQPIKKKKARKVTKVTFAKAPAVVLPAIKVIGTSIRNNLKQYTLDYAGEIYFKKLNETLNGISLVKERNDSLLVSFNGSQFVLAIGK